MRFPLDSIWHFSMTTFVLTRVCFTRINQGTRFQLSSHAYLHCIIKWLRYPYRLAARSQTFSSLYFYGCPTPPPAGGTNCAIPPVEGRTGIKFRQLICVIFLAKVINNAEPVAASTLESRSLASAPLFGQRSFEQRSAKVFSGLTLFLPQVPSVLARLVHDIWIKLVRQISLLPASAPRTFKDVELYTAYGELEWPTTLARHNSSGIAHRPACKTIIFLPSCPIHGACTNVTGMNCSNGA